MQQLEQQHPTTPSKLDHNSSNQQLEETTGFVYQLNSPEICQYDVWSDHELEQLNQFLQSNLDPIPHHQPTIVTPRSTPVTDQQHHLPLHSTDTHQRSSTSTQQPSPSSSELHQTKSPQRKHRRTSSPPRSIHSPPSSSPILPLPQPSHNESQPSPKPTKKRTFSSFFTTGNNLPIPMELDHEQLLNSGPHGQKHDDHLDALTDETQHEIKVPQSGPERKTLADHPTSSSPSLASSPSKFSNPSIQKPRPLSSSDSSQPSSSARDLPPIHPPRRTVSSIFQTGAGRPYPIGNGLEEKGSGSIGGEQGLSVFGFQTGRGTSVSAPSEQSVKKALELCTTNLTTPFPKRPFKEPESPSPSHRAKIQKSSPSQAFETSLSSADNESSIQGTSNNTLIPMDEVDTHRSTVGSLSTGSGVPVTISSRAIERTRALLDEQPRSSKLEQTSFNNVYSPLKDVTNVHMTSPRNNLMSMKADLLAGSHQSDSPISTSLMESLNAVSSKNPSQPTTAASLMSTPNRPTPKMFSSSGLLKLSTDDVTSIPPIVPHVTTAPVRRISNRMQIGLTPQSSRRVSHEGKPVTESRPFVTPFKKNLQGSYSHSKSVIASNNSPSTPVRGSAIQTYRQDETPLLDHTQRRVMYMESNHWSERQHSGASSMKPQSVYNIKSRMERRQIPMRVWLGPHKGYSARNLLSLAIPESVVFMTSKSSFVWTFNPMTDPFGSIHALDQLLKSGCLISRSSPTWVANHWGLIVWKLASVIRWRPDCFHAIWNPSYVVEQLKYRYEREFVHGHRSIIKRILDRDCLPNIPMCLVIVGIVRKGNQASTSSPQQVIELSDGWYKIKAVLDPVLTRTLKRGALKVGFKMALFGASTESIPTSQPMNSNDKLDTRKSTTSKLRDPKIQERQSLVNQEGEEGKGEELELFLEGNSTSRAKFDEMLGFRSSRKPWFASLKSVTFDGGKIPLMDLIVTKVHEPSFLDDGDRRIARESWNLELETKLRIAWQNEREKELNNIMNEERAHFERVERILNKISTLIFEGKTSSSPHLRNKKKHTDHEESNQAERNQSDGHVDGDDRGDKLVGGEIEVGSIHSQSSSSQFDADEMCEELIEEDEENVHSSEEDSMKALGESDANSGSWYSKINQISLNKLVKLRVAFESKIQSLRNSSIDLVHKKLDMRVPIRRTRKIQLLQVEDAYHMIHKNGHRNNQNKHQPRKIRSAQLTVHDLSRLPDGFFKHGNRYWVQNLQPQNRTHWDSKSDHPQIYLTTRRDSHWIPVGLNT